MKLPPFSLEHWLAGYEHATPPIRFNLGSSTGPPWTLAELLALDGGFASQLGETRVGYAPAAGHPALRREIAALTGSDPESVIVTTGASEAMSILFCLSAEPGSNVVLPNAAFPAFGAVAKAWGHEVRTYALRRDDEFRLSTQRVLDIVDNKTGLVLINTPHNPTGSVATRSQIETLARDLRTRDIPLVVDQVYHPLYFGTAPSPINDIDNVIVVGDMSKALSLPGLRTGWIIDTNAERRSRAIDARGYFTVSGSPVLEAIAAHVLRHRDVVFARLNAVTSANLASLSRCIDEHDELLAWVRPQGGTIAFPWFTDGRNTRAFCTEIASAGVLIVPGDCFGAPEHMRIGFGAQADGFADALDIMSQVLRTQ